MSTPSSPSGTDDTPNPTATPGTAGLRTDLSPERAANLAENPHAGQGAVMLDVGGDIGAIVLYLSAALEGAEIEIRPLDPESGEVLAATPDDGHAHDHDHEHDEDHGHGHGHGHGDGHAPHVAVVGRPAPDGQVLYSAVFPDLEAGLYRLTQAGESTSLDVTVEGGTIAEVTWPH